MLQLLVTYLLASVWQRNALSFTIRTTTTKRNYSSLLSSSLLKATTNTDERKTWQENLDNFLDPFTSIDKKQIILSDLINQNLEIRDSLQSAFEERNIDPILTPKAKQIQEGTKTVARQIRTDIIPQISKTLSDPTSITNNDSSNIPSPQDITSRIITQTSKTVQDSLDQLTKDLSDPSSVPERLSKQREEIIQEVSNIFRDTPEGLKGPPYTIVSSKDEYEIRDYETYIAASTSMLDDNDVEEYSYDNSFTKSGNGFNTLASYIFGNNKEEKQLSMTTPVAITNNGEMQFFLYNDDLESSNSKEDFPIPEDSDNAVNVKEIASCSLAVARFTGFVTDGEIRRQKNALVSALEKDGIEIDRKEDSIPYIILQYNPPYTLPVLRRNEIAIPVIAKKDDFAVTGDDDDMIIDDEDDVSPSDC